MSLHRSRLFRTELQTWLAEGIVTDEQAALLTDRYQLDAEPDWWRNGTTMIGIVAGLLICGGLVLFISENWHMLGIAARMATGLVPWCVAAGMALRAFRRQQDTTFELWSFAFCLLYGVNIFLQAQIFHLGGYYPAALQWWLLGCLPFALLFRRPSFVALCLVLLCVWLESSLSFDHGEPLGLLLFGALTWALVRSGGTIAMVMWGISLGWILAAVRSMLTTGPWYSDGSAPLFWAAYALSLFAVAVRYGGSVSVPGWLCRTVSWMSGLLIVGIAMGASVIQHHRSSVHGVDMVDHAMMVVAVTASVMVLWRRPVTVHTVMLPVLVTATYLVSVVQYAVGDGVAVDTFVFNLLLLGYALALITNGFRRTFKTDVMTGIAMLVVLAVLRYVDYFDDYLLAAGIFIVSGIGLFVLNSVWNRRFAS